MAKRYPTPTIPNCPDCKIPMAAGFGLDQSSGIATDRSTWVAGTAEDSMWTGLKLTGKLVFPITIFRCETCGLLRSYAFRPGERHG